MSHLRRDNIQPARKRTPPPAQTTDDSPLLGMKGAKANRASTVLDTFRKTSGLSRHNPRTAALVSPSTGKLELCPPQATPTETMRTIAAAAAPSSSLADADGDDDWAAYPIFGRGGGEAVVDGRSSRPLSLRLPAASAVSSAVAVDHRSGTATRAGVRRSEQIGRALSRMTSLVEHQYGLQPEAQRIEGHLASLLVGGGPNSGGAGGEGGSETFGGPLAGAFADPAAGAAFGEAVTRQQAAAATMGRMAEAKGRGRPAVAASTAQLTDVTQKSANEQNKLLGGKQQQRHTKGKVGGAASDSLDTHLVSDGPSPRAANEAEEENEGIEVGGRQNEEDGHASAVSHAYADVLAAELRRHKARLDAEYHNRETARIAQLEAVRGELEAMAVRVHEGTLQLAEQSRAVEERERIAEAHRSKVAAEYEHFMGEQSRKARSAIDAAEAEKGRVLAALRERELALQQCQTRLAVVEREYDALHRTMGTFQQRSDQHSLAADAAAEELRESRSTVRLLEERLAAAERAATRAVEEKEASDAACEFYIAELRGCAQQYQRLERRVAEAEAERFEKDRAALAEQTRRFEADRQTAAAMGAAVAGPFGTLVGAGADGGELRPSALLANQFLANLNVTSVLKQKAASLLAASASPIAGEGPSSTTAFQQLSAKDAAYALGDDVAMLKEIVREIKGEVAAKEAAAQRAAEEARRRSERDRIAIVYAAGHAHPLATAANPQLDPTTAAASAGDGGRRRGKGEDLLRKPVTKNANKKAKQRFSNSVSGRKDEQRRRKDSGTSRPTREHASSASDDDDDDDATRRTVDSSNVYDGVSSSQQHSRSDSSGYSSGSRSYSDEDEGEEEEIFAEHPPSKKKRGTKKSATAAPDVRPFASGRASESRQAPPKRGLSSTHAAPFGRPSRRRHSSSPHSPANQLLDISISTMSSYADVGAHYAASAAGGGGGGGGGLTPRDQHLHLQPHYPHPHSAYQFHAPHPYPSNPQHPTAHQQQQHPSASYSAVGTPPLVAAHTAGLVSSPSAPSHAFPSAPQNYFAPPSFIPQQHPYPHSPQMHSNVVINPHMAGQPPFVHHHHTPHVHAPHSVPAPDNGAAASGHRAAHQRSASEATLSSLSSPATLQNSNSHGTGGQTPTSVAGGTVGAVSSVSTTINLSASTPSAHAHAQLPSSNASLPTPTHGHGQAMMIGAHVNSSSGSNTNKPSAARVISSLLSKSPLGATNTSVAQKQSHTQRASAPKGASASNIDHRGLVVTGVGISPHHHYAIAPQSANANGGSSRPSSACSRNSSRGSSAATPTSGNTNSHGTAAARSRSGGKATESGDRKHQESKSRPTAQQQNSSSNQRSAPTIGDATERRRSSSSQSQDQRPKTPGDRRPTSTSTVHFGSSPSAVVVSPLTSAGNTPVQRTPPAPAMSSGASASSIPTFGQGASAAAPRLTAAPKMNPLPSGPFGFRGFVPPPAPSLNLGGGGGDATAPTTTTTGEGVPQPPSSSSAAAAPAADSVASFVAGLKASKAHLLATTSYTEEDPLVREMTAKIETYTRFLESGRFS